MSDEQSRSLNDNQITTDTGSQPYETDVTGGDTVRDPEGSNLESIPDGFTALEESGDTGRDPGGPGQDTSLDPGGSNAGDQEVTGGDTVRDPGGSNLESIPDGFTALEEPDRDPGSQDTSRDPGPQ